MHEDPAEIFKVLSVGTRIKIINLLKEKGSAGANEIAEQLGITPAAASQHLKILRHAGLVTSERQGFHIPYSINVKAMGHCHQILVEVCACGCPGSGWYDKKDFSECSLEELKAYKRELEDNLRFIEKKIDELQAGEE